MSVFIFESPHTWVTVYYYGIHGLELFNIIQGCCAKASQLLHAISQRNGIFIEDALKSKI